ncbi:MAG: ethanolamine ammonia-lyase subunit EutB [Rhodoferax sp.]
MTGLTHRRGFIGLLVGAPAWWMAGCAGSARTSPGPLPGTATTGTSEGISVSPAMAGEDLFAYLRRVRGGFDVDLYRGLLGAANEFKEGDVAQNIQAHDERSRANARLLLAATRVGDLVAHPVFEDTLFGFIESAVNAGAAQSIAGWTLGELKTYLLTKSEDEIKAIMAGLASDIIACVTKLMSNDELIAIGQKVFNPLAGSKIGAKGYLGARIQPNSPTDNGDDILLQVLDGFAYGVGDVMLGTNPVSSEVGQVRAVEQVLKDIRVAFGLENVIPHCVLSHIDIQAQVEDQFPGATSLWFQSLAGVDDANRVFDVSVDKMKAHAARRTGPYALYFETGQGADITNGQGKGFDIVLHEARKYGFARALKHEVAKARQRAGVGAGEPWLVLNDVAGFIGPEVFRTPEQLVRVCLEDIVMGKLHGLTIGLDICSTFHMDVTLRDLDTCIDRIMPANPAYLMALPTKCDPMLSYLSTGYQDHVRIREKFGYQVNDAMWAFFQRLGVIDAKGAPGRHFGDPSWVYMKYRVAQDPVLDNPADVARLIAQGKARIAEVRARGVFIAEGHGAQPWDLEPALERHIQYLYDDAKQAIWARLPEDFATKMGIPLPVAVRTQSVNREDYVLHPPTGEVLDADSRQRVATLRVAQAGRYNLQIVISDGLNALALTDPGHLQPYLKRLHKELDGAGYRTAPECVIVAGGRVRAGYRIGEMLFGSRGDRDTLCYVVHLIGERPGNGHRTFSAYITSVAVRQWAESGTIDHNVTAVVANIADTAFDPAQAATETLKILKQ